MFRFHHTVKAIALVVALTWTSAGFAKVGEAVERCNRAAVLLDQIMGTPESPLLLEMLRKSQCIALIPGVKKIGFGFGGKYGKGVLVCRADNRSGWTGPSTVKLEGGSFGLQIGASSTDVILMVMNDSGVDKLLSSKFTLGADAAVSAGPVGRSAQAQTDAQMDAKILSYSRSKGLFAGISLEGATLRPDARANEFKWGIHFIQVHPMGCGLAAPEQECEIARIVRVAAKPTHTRIHCGGSLRAATPRIGRATQPHVAPEQ